MIFYTQNIRLKYKSIIFQKGKATTSQRDFIIDTQNEILSSLKLQDASNESLKKSVATSVTYLKDFENKQTQTSFTNIHAKLSPKHTNSKSTIVEALRAITNFLKPSKSTDLLKLQLFEKLNVYAGINAIENENIEAQNDHDFGKRCISSLHANPYSFDSIKVEPTPSISTTSYVNTQNFNRYWLNTAKSGSNYASDSCIYINEFTNKSSRNSFDNQNSIDNQRKLALVPSQNSALHLSQNSLDSYNYQLSTTSNNHDFSLTSIDKKWFVSENSNRQSVLPVISTEEIPREVSSLYTIESFFIKENAHSDLEFKKVSALTLKDGSFEALKENKNDFFKMKSEIQLNSDLSRDNSCQLINLQSEENIKKSKRSTNSINQINKKTSSKQEPFQSSYRYIESLIEIESKDESDEQVSMQSVVTNHESKDATNSYGEIASFPKFINTLDSQETSDETKMSSEIKNNSKENHYDEENEYQRNSDVNNQQMFNVSNSPSLQACRDEIVLNNCQRTDDDLVSSSTEENASVATKILDDKILELSEFQSREVTKTPTTSEENVLKHTNEIETTSTTSSGVESRESAYLMKESNEQIHSCELKKLNRLQYFIDIESRSSHSIKQNDNLSENSQILISSKQKSCLLDSVSEKTLTIQEHEMERSIKVESELIMMASQSKASSKGTLSNIFNDKSYSDAELMADSIKVKPSESKCESTNELTHSNSFINIPEEFEKQSNSNLLEESSKKTIKTSESLETFNYDAQKTIDSTDFIKCNNEHYSTKSTESFIMPSLSSKLNQVLNSEDIAEPDVLLETVDGAVNKMEHETFEVPNEKTPANNESEEKSEDMKNKYIEIIIDINSRATNSGVLTILNTPQTVSSTALNLDNEDIKQDNWNKSYLLKNLTSYRKSDTSASSSTNHESCFEVSKVDEKELTSKYSSMTSKINISDESCHKQFKPEDGEKSLAVNKTNEENNLNKEEKQTEVLFEEIQTASKALESLVATEITNAESKIHVIDTSNCFIKNPSQCSIENKSEAGVLDSTILSTKSKETSVSKNSSMQSVSMGVNNLVNLKGSERKNDSEYSDIFNFNKQYLSHFINFESRSSSSIGTTKSNVFATQKSYTSNNEKYQSIKESNKDLSKLKSGLEKVHEESEWMQVASSEINQSYQTAISKNEEDRRISKGSKSFLSHVSDENKFPQYVDVPISFENAKIQNEFNREIYERVNKNYEEFKPCYNLENEYPSLENICKTHSLKNQIYDELLENNNSSLKENYSSLTYNNLLSEVSETSLRFGETTLLKTHMSVKSNISEASSLYVSVEEPSSIFISSSKDNLLSKNSTSNSENTKHVENTVKHHSSMKNFDEFDKTYAVTCNMSNADSCRTSLEKQSQTSINTTDQGNTRSSCTSEKSYDKIEYQKSLSEIKKKEDDIEDDIENESLIQHRRIQHFIDIASRSSQSLDEKKIMSTERKMAKTPTKQSHILLDLNSEKSRIIQERKSNQILNEESELVLTSAQVQENSKETFVANNFDLKVYSYKKPIIKSSTELTLEPNIELKKSKSSLNIREEYENQLASVSTIDHSIVNSISESSSKQETHEDNTNETFCENHGSNVIQQISNEIIDQSFFLKIKSSENEANSLRSFEIQDIKLNEEKNLLQAQSEERIQSSDENVINEMICEMSEKSLLKSSSTKFNHDELPYLNDIINFQSISTLRTQISSKTADKKILSNDQLLHSIGETAVKLQKSNIGSKSSSSLPANKESVFSSETNEMSNLQNSCLLDSLSEITEKIQDYESEISIKAQSELLLTATQERSNSKQTFSSIFAGNKNIDVELKADSNNELLETSSAASRIDLSSDAVELKHIDYKLDSSSELETSASSIPGKNEQQSKLNNAPIIIFKNSDELDQSTEQEDIVEYEKDIKGKKSFSSLKESDSILHNERFENKEQLEPSEMSEIESQEEHKYLYQPYDDHAEQLKQSQEPYFEKIEALTELIFQNQEKLLDEQDKPKYIEEIVNIESKSTVHSDFQIESKTELLNEKTLYACIEDLVKKNKKIKTFEILETISEETNENVPKNESFTLEKYIKIENSKNNLSELAFEDETAKQKSGTFLSATLIKPAASKVSKTAFEDKPWLSELSEPLGEEKPSINVPDSIFQTFQPASILYEIFQDANKTKRASSIKSDNSMTLSNDSITSIDQGTFLEDNSDISIIKKTNSNETPKIAFEANVDTQVILQSKSGTSIESSTNSKNTTSKVSLDGSSKKFFTEDFNQGPSISSVNINTSENLSQRSSIFSKVEEELSHQISINSSNLRTEIQIDEGIKSESGLITYAVEEAHTVREITNAHSKESRELKSQELNSQVSTVEVGISSVSEAANQQNINVNYNSAASVSRFPLTEATENCNQQKSVRINEELINREQPLSSGITSGMQDTDDKKLSRSLFYSEQLPGYGEVAKKAFSSFSGKFSSSSTDEESQKNKFENQINIQNLDFNEIQFQKTSSKLFNEPVLINQNKSETVSLKFSDSSDLKSKTLSNSAETILSSGNSRRSFDDLSSLFSHKKTLSSIFSQDFAEHLSDSTLQTKPDSANSISANFQAKSLTSINNDMTKDEKQGFTLPQIESLENLAKDKFNLSNSSVIRSEPNTSGIFNINSDKTTINVQKSISIDPIHKNSIESFFEKNVEEIKSDSIGQLYLKSNIETCLSESASIISKNSVDKKFDRNEEEVKPNVQIESVYSCKNEDIPSQAIVHFETDKDESSVHNINDNYCEPKDSPLKNLNDCIENPKYSKFPEARKYLESFAFVDSRATIQDEIYNHRSYSIISQNTIISENFNTDQVEYIQKIPSDEDITTKSVDDDELDSSPANRSSSTITKSGLENERIYITTSNSEQPTTDSIASMEGYTNQSIFSIESRENKFELTSANNSSLTVESMPILTSKRSDLEHFYDFSSVDERSPVSKILSDDDVVKDRPKGRVLRKGPLYVSERHPDGRNNFKEYERKKHKTQISTLNKEESIESSYDSGKILLKEGSLKSSILGVESSEKLSTEEVKSKARSPSRKVPNSGVIMMYRESQDYVINAVYREPHKSEQKQR